ncbi:MAG TPA: sigma-70 family RNA polymerase sigma factor [Gammaproteobacteria bacterium]|nr:sigma-70 family RNA polymerase sigma factor [Gammaproteobacteria bacterium]
MHDAASVDWMTDTGREQRIAAEIAHERPRLRNFIRRRVANDADVDDILQDVFAELVEAYRLMQPIEQVSAWLFRVARNRITDLVRKRRTEAVSELSEATGDDDMLNLDELLPSSDVGPEFDYLRSVMLDELDRALAELPPEQQDVFIAHELDGRSFKQLAAETGLSVNTLLARKHYAVRHLRQRLQVIYDEIRTL